MDSNVYHRSNLFTSVTYVYNMYQYIYIHHKSDNYQILIITISTCSVLCIIEILQ